MMQADRIALAENGRESFVFQPTPKAPPHSLPPSLSLSLSLSVFKKCVCDMFCRVANIQFPSKHFTETSECSLSKNRPLRTI